MMGAGQQGAMAEPPTVHLRAKPQRWWWSTYDVVDGDVDPASALSSELVATLPADLDVRTRVLVLWLAALLQRRDLLAAFLPLLVVFLS